MKKTPSTVLCCLLLVSTCTAQSCSVDLFDVLLFDQPSMTWVQRWESLDSAVIVAPSPDSVYINRSTSLLSSVYKCFLLGGRVFNSLEVTYDPPEPLWGIDSTAILRQVEPFSTCDRDIVDGLKSNHYTSPLALASKYNPALFLNSSTCRQNSMYKPCPSNGFATICQTQRNWQLDYIQPSSQAMKNADFVDSLWKCPPLAGGAFGGYFYPPSRRCYSVYVKETLSHTQMCQSCSSMGGTIVPVGSSSLMNWIVAAYFPPQVSPPIALTYNSVCFDVIANATIPCDSIRANETYYVCSHASDALDDLLARTLHISQGDVQLDSLQIVFSTADSLPSKIVNANCYFTTTMTSNDDERLLPTLKYDWRNTAFPAIAAPSSTLRLLRRHISKPVWTLDTYSDSIPLSFTGYYSTVCAQINNYAFPAPKEHHVEVVDPFYVEYALQVGYDATSIFRHCSSKDYPGLLEEMNEWSIRAAATLNATTSSETDIRVASLVLLHLANDAAVFLLTVAENGPALSAAQSEQIRSDLERVVKREFQKCCFGDFIQTLETVFGETIPSGNLATVDVLQASCMPRTVTVDLSAAGKGTANASLPMKPVGARYMVSLCGEASVVVEFVCERDQVAGAKWSGQTSVQPCQTSSRPPTVTASAATSAPSPAPLVLTLLGLTWAVGFGPR